MNLRDRAGTARTVIRATAAVALMGAWVSAASVPAGALEVVYIVRHAEKDTEWTGENEYTPLTEEGVRTAKEFGRRLADCEIGRVHTSHFIRALVTGIAAGEALNGVAVVSDESAKWEPESFARGLEAKHAADKAILVVGHSETVAELVRGLRAEEIDACLERLGLPPGGKQYGDIWRVEMGQPGCQGITRHRVRKDPLDCSSP